MRFSYSLHGCLLALAVLFGQARSGEPADYPPATRLKDQVLLAEPSEKVRRWSATRVGNIQRGHEAVHFSVELDRGRGLRWFVYDTAQRKITRVHDDLSGQPAATTDTWTGIDRWRRRFEQADREDLLTIGHLEKGFGCSAEPGSSLGKPAKIFVERPSLPDGRIFTTGTVYGLPEDRNYMPRYRDGEPYRLDCAALIIDKLPQGILFE